jgi:hypothetical protein
MTYVTDEKLTARVPGVAAIHTRRETLMINVTRKMTKKMKNMNLATLAEAAAIPVNPNTAAKIAISRNANAQPSIWSDLQLGGSKFVAKSESEASSSTGLRAP